MAFQKIFNKKLQAPEIILQNKGALKIDKRPLPNHGNDRGQGQVLMVSTSGRDIEGGVLM